MSNKRQSKHLNPVCSVTDDEGLTFVVTNTLAVQSLDTPSNEMFFLSLTPFYIVDIYR